MKLSTKGRYAMVALVDLALAQKSGNELVSLAEVSKRQDISLPYLEQLFVKLRRAGLVEAVRGPGAATSSRGPRSRSGSARSWKRWKRRSMRCIPVLVQVEAFPARVHNP